MLPTCSNCGSDSFAETSSPTQLDYTKERNLDLQYESVSEAYLGVIAQFLKALWLVFISGLIGAVAMSMANNSHADYLRCEQNGDMWTTCSDSSIAFFLFLGIPSLLFLIFALIAGFRAMYRFNEARG